MLNTGSFRPRSSICAARSRQAQVAVHESAERLADASFGFSLEFPLFIDNELTNREEVQYTGGGTGIVLDPRIKYNNW
jgi:hypothetical protein